jgi:hypothetical protein
MAKANQKGIQLAAISIFMDKLNERIDAGELDSLSKEEMKEFLIESLKLNYSFMELLAKGEQ